MSALKVVIISIILFASVHTAPLLSKVTFDEDWAVVKIYGEHFGFRADHVHVILDGYEHRVLSVNDSVIICDTHVDHKVQAGPEMSVYVEIESENTNATFSVVLESAGENILDAGQKEDIYAAPPSAYGKYKMIVIAFIPILAGAFLLGGFLVMRKRKLSASSNIQTSTVDQTKSDNHAIVVSTPNPIVMVRDSSMEEIDLNADATTTTQTEEAQCDDIYDLHRSESSSSFSSFSSTYSSTNCTPTSFSPDTPSSPRLDFSDYVNSEVDTGKRKKIKSTMCDLDEPISRLGKRSMDSPYFAKQNGFDSPLTTSQEITPSSLSRRSSVFDSPRTTPVIAPNSGNNSANNNVNNHSNNALHTSQEINMLHASPFDSPCVLHTAIQRAAMLRQQQQTQQQTQQQALQQQQPSSPQQQPSMILVGGRRASMSAGNQKLAAGRRSSLGTSSLHVAALHNSTGIAYSERKQHQKQRKQQKQQRMLRTSQYIQQFDEPLVEGDE